MAGISQTKTYGVSYVIHGDASKLTSALTGAKEQASLLSDALSGARTNMQALFGHGSNLTESFEKLNKFYSEAIKAQKSGQSNALSTSAKLSEDLTKKTKALRKQLESNPIISEKGLIGANIVKSIQSQLNAHKFGITVSPILSANTHATLQEQLNTKEFTINVKANVTGIQQQKSGTAAPANQQPVSKSKTRSNFSIQGINRAPLDKFPISMQHGIATRNAMEANIIAEHKLRPIQEKWERLSMDASTYFSKAERLLKNGVGNDSEEYKKLNAKAGKAQSAADNLWMKKLKRLQAKAEKASSAYYSAADKGYLPYLVSSDWFPRDKNGKIIMPTSQGTISSVSSKKPYSSPTASVSSNGMAQLKQGLTQLQNYIKANPLTGNFRVNYGESRTQVQRIIGNLRQYAMTKPIRVPVEVVWGNAGGQLQNILSGLQSFANGHGIKTTAKVSGTATGGSTGAGSTLTDEQKKESAIRSAARSKWSSMLDKQLGNYYPGWKEEQMAKYDKWAAKFPGMAGAERLQNFSENYRQRLLRQSALDKFNKQAERIEKKRQTDKQRVADSAIRDIEKDNKAEQKAQENAAKERAKRTSRVISAKPNYDRMLQSRADVFRMLENTVGRDVANAQMASFNKQFNELTKEKGIGSAAKTMTSLYQKTLNDHQRSVASASNERRERAIKRGQDWYTQQRLQEERAQKERAQRFEEQMKAERQRQKEYAKEQDRLQKQALREQQRIQRMEQKANAQRVQERIARNQRIAQRAMIPYGAPTGGGRGDIYTRMRKSWYPFTGNTSFGARTPMALDMAKGMGMMFAVSGVMQAVTSSFHQVAEYENMMKTVQAILKTNDGGANFNGRFKAMEEEVRRVGRETKFTAPEVAGAARFMAMAGLGIEDINAATNPIANLALVGDNDMSTTADKMTNIMTSFGLLKGLTGSQKKANMRHTSDVLTNTFTKSNTDLIQLAEAMQYAGPMSHLTGTSLEDAAAMVGVMGNAGIQSSMAGTTLRMMYQNIIKPNKKQAAEWKRLGINTKDDQGRNRDIFEILKDLRAKITGTTDLNSKVGADQLKIMGAEVMSLFRTTAGAGTAALLENLGEAINLANSNRESNGIAQTIADEKKNTISGLWAQVTSTFTDQSVNTVNEFVETIKDMLRSLRDWLASKEAADTLRSIYDLAKSLIDVFGGVAKVWMKIYNLAPNVIKWFITFQMWATQLGFLTTPIIQVVGAITTLKNSLVGLVGGLAGASTAISGGRIAGAVGGAVNGILYNRANPLIVPAGARGPVSAAVSDVLTGGRANPHLLKEYQKRAKLYGDDTNFRPFYSIPFAISTPSSGWRKSGGSTIGSATSLVNERAERIRAIKAYRYQRAADKAKLIQDRANRIYGWDSNRFKRLITEGMTMTSFAGLWNNIKSTALSVFSSIARGIGALLSPVSAATMGLIGLGVAIWKVYEHAKELDRQQKAAAESYKKMSDALFKDRENLVNMGNAIGGFKTVTSGYSRDLSQAPSSYTLSSELTKGIFNDTSTLKPSEVIKNYVSLYNKYLPKGTVDNFLKNNSDYSQAAGTYGVTAVDTNSLEKAKRLAVIAQWAKFATEQEDVQKAAKAILEAQSKGDQKQVRAILDQFKVPTNAKSMLSMNKDAEELSKLENADKTYEFMYAQLNYLKEIAEKMDIPIQNYTKAMDLFDKLPKQKEEISPNSIKELATTLLKAQSIDWRGKTGSLLFKNGKVDWTAMAASFNEKIPFTSKEQQQIMYDIFKNISENDKMQKRPEILELLKIYLPKIAQAKIPYYGMEDNERVKFYVNFLKRKDAPKTYAGRHAEQWLREHGYDKNGKKIEPKTITPPSSDQSEYGSKYNNHQARPTQIIFKIDQLCKFEGTQVNSLDQKGIAESVGRQMAEGLQIMFAQAASDFAIIGDSNG